MEFIKSCVGKRGTVVIAASFRSIYGLKDGSDIVQEATPEGILIRPAATVPVKLYSDQEKAAFLLNNAGSAAEYQAARREVSGMGLNPDKIKHLPFE